MTVLPKASQAANVTEGHLTPCPSAAGDSSQSHPVSLPLDCASAHSYQCTSFKTTAAAGAWVLLGGLHGSPTLALTDGRRSTHLTIDRRSNPPRPASGPTTAAALPYLPHVTATTRRVASAVSHLDHARVVTYPIHAANRDSLVTPCPSPTTTPINSVLSSCYKRLPVQAPRKAT